MAKRNMARIAAVLMVLALWIPGVRAAVADSLAVERQVYDYLTGEMELNSAAACGILANMEHESAFQPNIVGDQGTSYGLCQWHNERYTALRAYCMGRGMDYRTVEGQLAYLDFELNSTYTSLLGALKNIPNTPDGAYRAAYLWCVHFERPVDPEKKGVTRGNLAKFKYWNRYNSMGMMEEETVETLPAQQVITNIQQDHVSIPVPPEENVTRTDRFVAQRPALKYYILRQMPVETVPVELPEENLLGVSAIGFAVSMVFQVMGDGRKYGFLLPEPEWTELDIPVV